MKKRSYGDREPIAALATPLAESALALIRVAGGGFGEESQSAIELLSRLFSRPEKLGSAPGNSLVYGWIIDPSSGQKIDEVMVSVYRAPRSYTGEDGAEISCHGGIAAVKAVLALLNKAGFREALPGEFTFRAFMNGKLDLTRAESVMELVAAKTGRGREQALRRLAGALEKEISRIKALLVEVLAGTEICLDYSEDEIEPDDDEIAGRLPLRNLAEEAAGRLRVLAENWRRERIYAEGALVVIAGRPNAGKSSLFNYLLREDRSIVTGAPGTTRDWIEALVSLEDIPLRLVDTAGLRDLRGSSSENTEAERIGIERTLELLDRAELVLYLIDGLEGISPEDRDFFARHRESASLKPIIIIWNKLDLAQPVLAGDELPGLLLALSAKTGEGISELTHSINACLFRKELAQGAEEAAGPGTLRQKELIDAALASVEEALALTAEEAPLDIIAPLFRSAVNALGEITGEVSSADILDIMFSRFCVGK
jgi:tRNA modification GTPase